MRFPSWLINLSVFVNHLTCGPDGYSLCARFWEGKLDGRWFHTVMAAITDRIFWFDPDHCRKAWLFRNR